MRAILALGFLLGACSGGPSGSLVDLSGDPNSGCAGAGNSIYGGGYILHIGKGSGDSGEVNAMGCKVTSGAQMQQQTNPVNALPAGATMTVTIPPAPAAH